MTDKKKTLETLLENTRRELFENTVHNDQPKYDPVLLPIIGKVMSNIIAADIVGVQPMTGRPMTVGEMSHACSTWYWAQPAYGPGGAFVYEETRQRNQDIADWSAEVYGPKGDWSDPDCRWYTSDGKYIFKNEGDRTMFVLRWS